MEWAIAVLIVAVLGTSAAIAAGASDGMATEPVRDTYRQDLSDGRLSGDDIRDLRFAVAVRGYGMEQVDEVLARLSGEIAERDHQIEQLRSATTTPRQ